MRTTSALVAAVVVSLTLSGCEELLDDTTGGIAGRLTFGVPPSQSGFWGPRPGKSEPVMPPEELARMVSPLWRLVPAPVRTTREVPGFVEGELLVRFVAKGLTADEVLRQIPLPGVRLSYGGAVTSHWHRLVLHGARGRLGRAETANLLAPLKRLPGVTAVEVNGRVVPLAVPGDPLYKYQWHLGQMQLPAAWDVTQGSEQVVVAVVDTGILPGHPDFEGRLLQGIDMISDPDISLDGDGRDNDPTDKGKDGPRGDSSWHGTHVAGTIGAATNNGKGVAGVDWKCRILPVRVLGKGGGTNADIVAGMAWAAGLSVPGVRTNDRPAHVVNMSLGGDGAPSALYQEVIDEAAAKGTVFVVAAGNENEDTAQKNPANQENVIVVGAVGFDGKRASYSNYGAEVDVMAPGGEMAVDADGDSFPDGVFSTYASETGSAKYDYLQGTSMATPHVAGLVALMKARSSVLTPAQAERILKETAVAAGKCSEGCGAGLVNAYAAVLKVTNTAPTGPAKLSVTNREVTLGATMKGSLGVANIGGQALTVRATASGPLASRLTFTGGQSKTLQPAAMDVFSVQVDPSGLAAGDHGVNVELDAGTAGTATVRVAFRIGAAGPVRATYVAALYLDEQDEWQVGGAVKLDSGVVADYELTDLEPREDYVVLAGVDDDGNGEPFDDGERFGFWRNLDAPELVEVTAGEVTKGIDFAVVTTGAAPEEDEKPVPVGAPCRTKSDCGTGGLCDTSVEGGYCIKPCPGGSDDCPSGSDCFDIPDPYCLATCPTEWGGQSTCRDGHICWGTTSGPAPICMPRCTADSCSTGAECNLTTGYCEK